MAFGQSSGPPATGKQLRELTELLEAAGHSDFRDARGPMGFTQRQAGGKFTRDEADEFIARLEAEAEGNDAPSTPPPAVVKRVARPRATTKTTANSDDKPPSVPTTTPAPAPKQSKQSKQKEQPKQSKDDPKQESTPAPKKVMTLAEIPAERLAAELQRRGWVVLEP